MKILITTDTYFPMINGVVTSLNNLYKELKSSGHDVKVLTLSHDGNEKVVGDVYYLKSLGIKVYPDARIKYPLHNKLINEILKWSPNVIHSQTEFSMMLMSKYIANKLNIPHVHTYHTMYENYLDYLLGGKLINKSASIKITRVLLNSLDCIIAPTEKTKNTLLNYGVNKPIYVVPTGIDLSRFHQEISCEKKQELLLKLHINEDDRIIAYVGRVAEEKNISEIISFLPSIITKFKNIKLLVVGGGPYLDDLKNQVIKQNLVKHVIFTGMINPEEINLYYRISEIFITASTSETQGLTYIEALSCGCPVVCKYDPCIDGVIEPGKNGFSYKDKQQFINYVLKLLQDNCLRKLMSKEAIIRSQQYSSTNFANKIFEKYVSITHFSEDSNVSSIKFANPKA